MFQDVHILCCDRILFSCHSSESLSFHVLALATDHFFCIAWEVMIKKRGKESESCSKSHQLVQTHLKRHVHLTNCIHLKHHLHMQKPRIMVENPHPTELSLLRELAVLQKSRALRDPSTSPSWMSARIGSLHKTSDSKETNKDDSGEHKTIDDETKNISTKVAPILASSISKRTGKGVLSISRRSPGNDSTGRNEWCAELRARDSHEEGLRAWDTRQHSSIHHMHHNKTDISAIKSLAKRASQLKVDVDSGRVVPEKSKLQERISTHSLSAISRKNDKRKEPGSSMDDKSSPETEDSDFPDSYAKSRYPVADLMRSRKWKKNKNSRSRASGRKAKYKEGLDSAARSTFQKQHEKSSLVSKEEKDTSTGNKDLEFMELSHIRCGIPCNWSQIHKRGKSFLDFAGRSLSCRASEQNNGKNEAVMARYHASASGDSMVPTGSERSESSFDSSSESVPLLLRTGPPLEGFSAGESNMEIGMQRHTLARSGRSPQLHWVLVNEDRQLSLSQKYSPKSFKEIVGQNFVTQALSNALNRKRIVSMYIFYGPRGTGKTSCAKVFAAALNCISSEEQKPCGSCSECLDHFLGKTCNVKEVNAAEKHGTKVMKALIHDLTWSASSRTPPPYKVFIVDESHALSVHAWNLFFKVLERVPRNIVFILFTTSLEELPYAVVSRCQKFLFTKIKESVIENRLYAISVLENLDIDSEAVKLIASMADGSLRDGEMMLDQLSLFGKKISLSTVQEFAGLIPDDKLFDLLDAALSADTVNTVRRLKDLVESGVEPLSLMSQLATMITNVLGGGYKIPKESNKRKFFCRNELSKEEMERLRLALKTLSEAEKQLRASSDQTTWLTAALLQFAPDKSQHSPGSSTDASSTQGIHTNFSDVTDFGPSTKKKSGYLHTLKQPEHSHVRISRPDDIDAFERSPGKSLVSSKTPISKQVKQLGSHSPQLRDDMSEAAGSSNSFPASQRGKCCNLRGVPELEDIWQRVLDAVHSNNLRQFLQTHARLLSINTSKAFLVAYLEFSQDEHQSRAERSKKSIAHAFQVAFGRKVEVKVSIVMHKEKQKSSEDSEGQPSSLNSEQKPTVLELAKKDNADGNLQRHQQQDGFRVMHKKVLDSLDVREIGTPNAHQENNQDLDLVVFEGGDNPARKGIHTNNDRLECMWTHNEQDSPRHSIRETYMMEEGQNSKILKSGGTGKSKLSLGSIIQQDKESVERCGQNLRPDHTSEVLIHKRGGHRGQKIFTTAEEETSSLASKLEEENLRLESRSGGLFCWKLVKRGQIKVKKLHCCS